MNEHTCKLVSKQELQRSKIELSSGLKSDILACIHTSKTLKISIFPEAKCWQDETVSMMTETGKEIDCTCFFQSTGCPEDVSTL